MPDEVEISSSEDFVKKYYSYIFVKILVVIGLVVAVFLVAGYAITIGAGDVSMMETYGYIWNHIIGTHYEYRSEDWFKDYAIWNIRAPRVFAAIITGFGLAVCGCVMQSITKNPLADPYTTGISSGAVFGVSIAMVFGFSLGTGSGNLGLMFNAFIFGLIPAIFIIIVASSHTRSAATIVLAGIAITYIFSSLSTITMMFASEATIKKAYLWQLGTMERVTVDMLPIMFFGVLACSVVVYVFSRQLNLLYLGTGSASTLGLDVATFRSIMIIIVALLTSTIISFTGVIGFVGLVAPHIMRQFISSDNRFLIPASGLLGGAFILICDTIGRSPALGWDAPVGVIMSFVGAPLFLWIIVRSKKGAL